jgi:hypothetical protein
MTPVKFVLAAGLGLAAMAVVGCASDLPRRATTFTAEAATQKEIVFTSDVPVEAKHMYDRVIRAASRWRLVGRVPEGDVYRPAGDGVFSVERANVHEAYLVIANRALVGVYLPVEKAFTEVDRVDPLPIQ